MAVGEKYISFREIVEGLYRDLKLQEELNVNDVLEWCAEALSAIGVASQYRQRVTDDCDHPYLEVVGHRACLPKDYSKVIQISYNGYPLNHASSSFGNISTDTETTSTGVTNNGVTPIDVDHFPNLTTGPILNANETYTINNSYLVTSFREGSVVMSYLAVALDDEGFPLIPDNYYYIKAIKAYVTMMLDRIEWRAGRMRDNVFEHSRMDWGNYVRAAKGAGLMPSIPQTENIKNQWLSLMPRINSYNEFFGDLGSSTNLTHH